MSLQWYPGHMTKARRELAALMPSQDVIIEVLDARLPAASSNPLLTELRKQKPCIKVLTRSDLADPAADRGLARALPQSAQRLGVHVDDRPAAGHAPADQRAEPGHGAASRSDQARARADRGRAQCRQVDPAQHPDESQRRRGRRQARDHQAAASGHLERRHHADRQPRPVVAEDRGRRQRLSAGARRLDPGHRDRLSHDRHVRRTYTCSSATHRWSWRATS